MGNFIIAPIEILSSDLSPTEMKVLFGLYSYRGKNTNTVWPSTSNLAKRVGIEDVTRISKITTSLQKKGWLKKRKMGFDKPNQYELCVPEIEPSNLDKTTNLDESSNLDENALSNLDEYTKSNLDESANLKKPKKKPKKNIRPCPSEKIIDLFNNTLPELGQVKIVSEQRKSTLRTRWRESEKHRSVDFWQGYFEHIKQSDFLMGRVKDWRADFDWLIKSSNFVKVIEGNYHR